MREKCIFHIGMHKTGTTSLQNAMSNHLNDPKFHYAEIDQLTSEFSHNRSFSTIFKKNPYTYHGNQSMGWTESEVDSYKAFAMQRINNSFKNNNREVVEIISGEDIGYLDYDEVLELRKLIRSYFDKVIIFAYIRSPRSYINSAAQELIKHGLNKFNFTFAAPNYNRFLMFANIFGIENTIYKSYDEIINKNNNVVIDFCNTFDISCSSSALNIVDNQSLSLDAASILYVYQKFTTRKHDKFYFVTQNRLINALSALKGNGLFLGEKIVSSLITNDKESIEFLENVMRTKLDIHYKLDVNDNKVIDDEYSLIEHSIQCFDKLKNLLLSYDVSSDSSERSEVGVVNLVRLLDSKINGNLLNISGP